MGDESSFPERQEPGGFPPWIRSGEPGAFPTTHWTRVHQAAGEGTVAEEALESICRDYWYPLYVFARRNGHSSFDAQDLTQGFFEALLRGVSFAQVDRAKGRLRSYLLGGMKHYMTVEWRRESAAKRGGGKAVISIDGQGAEARLQAEGDEDPSLHPDKFFDRCWALDLLERVTNRLERHYHRKGQRPQFEVLAQFLGWNGGEETYAAAGEKIGMKEGAVKIAVHRMRQRYGELLRDEIAQTVSKATDIGDELDALVAALQ